MEKIARNEVPAHTGYPGIQEEVFARDPSSSAHTDIGLCVKRIEQNTGNEIRWPDCRNDVREWKFSQEGERVLIEGGWTRNRRKIPPMEKPSNCVDITNNHWSAV